MFMSTGRPGRPSKKFLAEKAAAQNERELVASGMRSGDKDQAKKTKSGD